MQSISDRFSNLNFFQKSPLGDGFSYEMWEGNADLVKLNLKNSAVCDHLTGAVKMWIEELGIDGLRLDAADCVDKDFFKLLRRETAAIRPSLNLSELVNMNPSLIEHIKNLVQKRQSSKVLRLGTYEKLFVKNEQFAFARKYENKTAIVVFNVSDNSEKIIFQYSGKQYDLVMQPKSSWITIITT